MVSLKKQTIVVLALALVLISVEALAKDDAGWKKLSSLVEATKTQNAKECAQTLKAIKTFRDGACSQALYADAAVLYALTSSPSACGKKEKSNKAKKRQYAEVLTGLLKGAEYGSAWGAAYSLEVMSVFDLGNVHKIEKALHYLENNNRPKIILENSQSLKRHIETQTSWDKFKRKVVLETGSLKKLAKEHKSISALPSDRAPTSAEIKQALTGALGENAFFGRMFVPGDGC